MHISFIRPLFQILLVFGLLFAHGCSSKQPLFILPTSHYPVFTDDKSFAAMQQAVENSLAYLKTLAPSTNYQIGELDCSVADLIATHQLFLRYVSDAPDATELSNIIKREFDLYQAGGVSGFNPRRTMLVTSYYQPVFEGSLLPTSKYRYPLYKVPKDLVSRLDEGEHRAGRLVDGKLVSYWSRHDIEVDNHLSGQELLWLKNPVDVFFLHVQGSAIIELLDGTTRSVQYGGRNGLEYKSIGKYMVEQGMITLEEASLDTIRAYLENHPEQQDTILHQNPSYIFFKWGSTNNAIGSMGQPLTPGRSVAADKAIFPPGTLAFLHSRKPWVENTGKVQWKPMSRFVTVQDTGSAIKGPGRVDLFWGTGKVAGQAAGMMKEKGELYILLKKQQPGHE